jgi:hypothetical protein
MAAEAVTEYFEIGQTQTMTQGFLGLFFKKPIVPNDVVKDMVNDFIRREKKKHNQILSDSFDMPGSGFTKFEFHHFDEKLHPAAGTTATGERVVYQFPTVDATTIYVLGNSVISFKTQYRVQVWEKLGCGGKGKGQARVMATGGKNYEAEQYFYRHIQAVSVRHVEDTYRSLNATTGCSGGIQTVTVKRELEKFILRATENFEALAFMEQAKDLNECRKLINTKLNEVNTG